MHICDYSRSHDAFDGSSFRRVVAVVELPAASGATDATKSALRLLRRQPICGHRIKRTNDHIDDGSVPLHENVQFDYPQALPASQRCLPLQASSKIFRGSWLWAAILVGLAVYIVTYANDSALAVINDCLAQNGDEAYCNEEVVKWPNVWLFFYLPAGILAAAGIGQLVLPRRKSS